MMTTMIPRNKQFLLRLVALTVVLANFALSCHLGAEEFNELWHQYENDKIEAANIQLDSTIQNDGVSIVGVVINKDGFFVVTPEGGQSIQVVTLENFERLLSAATFGDLISILPRPASMLVGLNSGNIGEKFTGGKIIDNFFVLTGEHLVPVSFSCEVMSQEIEEALGVQGIPVLSLSMEFTPELLIGDIDNGS